MGIGEWLSHETNPTRMVMNPLVRPHDREVQQKWHSVGVGWARCNSLKTDHQHDGIEPLP